MSVTYVYQPKLYTCTTFSSPVDSYDFCHCSLLEFRGERNNHLFPAGIRKTQLSFMRCAHKAKWRASGCLRSAHIWDSTGGGGARLCLPELRSSWVRAARPHPPSLARDRPLTLFRSSKTAAPCWITRTLTCSKGKREGLWCLLTGSCVQESSEPLCVIYLCIYVNRRGQLPRHCPFVFLACES